MPLYDNGCKQTWRGTMWRQIANRCPKLERPRAKVCYLVGEENYDLASARKHKFRDENLIAVDLDADRARRARKDGILSINAPLHEVIRMERPDIVFADMMCGLSWSTLDPVIGACFEVNPQVVAFNLQRGRDSSGSEWRETFSGAFDETVAEFPDLTFDGIRSDPRKHRGVLLHRYIMAEAFMLDLTTGGDGIPSMLLDGYDGSEAFFYEYRPNKVWMDSVVCFWPVNGHVQIDPEPTPLKVRRKVAAARAIHTMQKRGKL